MIHTQTINTLPELHRQISRWGNISSGRMAPTHHLDWVNSCAESFTNDGSLFILTASEHSLPVSVAPFCLLNYPAPHLELLGARQLGEPTDLIYQDSDTLKHLISALIKKKLPVLLHRLPADSLTPELFKKLSHGHGITLIREQSSYPYIALGSNLDKQSLLSTSLMNDLKRAAKKANSIGKVTFQITSPSSPKDTDESYQTYLQIEAASWKGDNGTALIHDAERNRFFHDFCHRASQSGTFRVSFMYIDQQPVSAILALVLDKRFWILKTAYDKDYKRCSPGLLLIKHTLDDVIQHGLSSFEFLGQTEPWLKRWTKTERKTVKLSYYPYNFTGIKLLSHDTAMKLFRYILKPH